MNQVQARKTPHEESWGYVGKILWFFLMAILMGTAVLMIGCAPNPATKRASTGRPPLELITNSLAEIPVPESPWRPHLVSWCESDGVAEPQVEKLLSLCAEYFREGSGSDGILELELALEQGQRHPLILLTLGQLYLIAGQGEPELLPPEGPAADVGDWTRNKKRLLDRAELLLLEAVRQRPADAILDYLLADVARARGDRVAAGRLVSTGAEKCTSGRGLTALILYQQLNQYPGRYLGGPGPEYPLAAQKKRIAGDVVLDLLISPKGEVRQAVVVESPGFTLSRAAAASLQAGSWEASRVGKYPIWSWLRVKTSFTLSP